MAGMFSFHHLITEIICVSKKLDGAWLGCLVSII